jgi:UDP-GlcNAc:undecaprenyl-phosphate GlcNAc-1-phosphate transferase
MSSLVISFLISLLISFFIIRYRRLHEHVSGDHDTTGIQKFHFFSVPRIGGIGIYFGLLIALAFRWTHNAEAGVLGLVLIFCAIPAFIVGLAEDLTKKISIRLRLISTVIATAAAGLMLNAWIKELQIPLIDSILNNYFWLSVIITCVAVTGVANSFNIIDGYNGLSSMVAMIILVAIGYVAFKVHDPAIMVAALAMIGSILGFFVWNYPRGLLFLGDGGAYLVGFWIAELSILLTIRNEEVSVWFPLLICAYPIFETLFTMYRRLILRRSHPGVADAVHLHHLIYKRVVRWAIGSPSPTDGLVRNSLTSPYLWGLCLLSVMPGIIFWQDTLILQIFCVCFIVIYVFLYRRLVKFSAPKWMTLKYKK